MTGDQPALPAGIASPKITEVLAVFLDEQRSRLRPATARQYESVISLFKASMDRYAANGLEEAERACFEKYYNADGDAHREFCDIFGPDKIPENVGEFLHWFMPRKVICGRGLLKASGTVIRKLGAWLAAKGHIGHTDEGEMTEAGRAAARHLPVADDILCILQEYAAAHAPRRWTDEHEGLFFIDRIGAGRLWLDDLSGAGSLAVAVPREIDRRLEVDWQIEAKVGKAKHGWHLIEVYAVSPA